MSKLVKRDILQNFGGGAKSDIAGIYLPSGFVPESLNVDFSLERGAARKRKGYKRVKATYPTGSSNSVVVGLYEAQLGPLTTRLAIFSPKTADGAGSIYSWDGSDTFTSEGSFSGSVGKNDLVDFCVTRTDTRGFVVAFTNGDVTPRIWDGYNDYALDLAGANGGGDLGIDYFRCKYITSFKNHFFMANTSEGNDALADTWTQGTGGAAPDYPTNTYKFDDTIVNEIHSVYHSGSIMTYNEGGWAALSANEYDVYENELYVRCTADADPAGNIKVVYRCHERLRWSALGDAEDHTNTNFIDIVTEPGKEIMKIVPLRDLLMVYKEDSIWAVYSTGDSEAPFGTYCVDHNTPCYAGFSVADVKGEHFFLSEEGIMKTNGAKVEPVLVSSDVPQWFDGINKKYWQYSYASVNPYLKQYRLLIPNIGGTDVSDKDREIRFDYQSGVWSEHKYAGNANVIATATNEETVTWDDETRRWDDIDMTWDNAYWLGGKPTRFYTGDYSGYVREHDVVEYDDEGATDAIEAYVVTKPLNLSKEEEDIDKNKKLLKARGRLKTGTGISLDVYKKQDGASGWTSVGSIDCDQTGESFEGQIDMSGTCKELQYKLGNNAATQPFCIYWWLTKYLIRSDK